MSVGGVNPGAKSKSRIRYNWARIVKGAVADTLIFTPPLNVDPTDGSISIETDSSSGLIVRNGNLEAETYEFLANGTVSGNKVVRLVAGKVAQADSSTAGAGDQFGFAINGATDGNPVFVRAFGELDSFSGLSVDGEYFLGTSGAITLTPPTTGLLVKLGHAISATTLFINPGTPVIRS